MSLIEEALRRVQDPLIPHQHAQAPPASVKPTAKTAQAKPAHPWPTTATAPAAPATVRINPLMAVAVAVLTLTSVVIIGAAFWMGRTMARTESPTESPEEKNAELTELTSPAPPRAAAPFPKPAPFKEIPILSIPWVKNPPPPPKQAFALSGVIEGGGEPYAVINGMIFGVGEQVGKATVVEISNGAVKLLLANGKETILRVSP